MTIEDAEDTIVGLLAVVKPLLIWADRASAVRPGPFGSATETTLRQNAKKAIAQANAYFEGKG